MWMVTAKACAASFGLLTLHANLGLANYMTNPAVHSGTAMHDTDKSLPGDHGSVVPPPAQVSTETAAAETGSPALSMKPMCVTPCSLDGYVETGPIEHWRGLHFQKIK
jgi:hypothetical protein